MPFTTCQAKALHLLNGSDNIFLTGAAGTGKSFLLQQFLHDKPKKTYPVLASTGTAALLVNGRTFHSFFGLGILEGGRAATVARVLNGGRSIKRIQAAQCIVIDEISMLSGETLAAAEEIARRAREVDAPWGGLRIIAVGDFAQLPPVQTDVQKRDWAFAHPVWEATNFQPIYLETPVRTTESTLLSVLNDIRAGVVSDEVQMFLERRRYDEDLHFDGTRLFARRHEADAYNHRCLNDIAHDLYEFATQYAGDARAIEQLKKQSPIPEILAIKVGALVMLRKNDHAFPYKYVNGSLGTVVAISREELQIRLLSGPTVTITLATFSILDGNGYERASAVNFPVSLAWATTIHKSQGASIDRLLVNISGLWESGQAYVALSRATSADGVFIGHWDPRSILIDPLVKQFYATTQEQWQHTATSVPEDNSDVVSATTKRPSTPPKTPNHQQTAALLKEKQSLAQIAQTLGFKEGTIIGHIEKLLREESEDPDIHYLRPPADIFTAISRAFDEHGMEYLKPVHEELNGEYSYDEIKLVRLFLL